MQLEQGMTAGPTISAQQTASTPNTIVSSSLCRQLQDRPRLRRMHQSCCLRAIACRCMHASTSHVSCSLPSFRGVPAPDSGMRQQANSIQWPCSWQRSSLAHWLPDRSNQQQHRLSCTANYATSIAAICRSGKSERTGQSGFHSHTALPLPRLSSVHQQQHHLTSCCSIRKQASSSRSIQAVASPEASSLVEDQVQPLKMNWQRQAQVCSIAHAAGKQALFR